MQNADTKKEPLSSFDNSGLRNEDEGTRTLNLRIDSPMLEGDKSFKNRDLDKTAQKPYRTAYRKHPKNEQEQGDSYPPELLRIAKVWNALPEHIKAAIKALVEPFSGESE